MNSTPKEKIIQQAKDLLKPLTDDINHPEGIILLAHLKHDESMIAAMGCVIGCSHGIENALYSAAEDNDKLAEAIIRTAKKLKKKRKENPNTELDELLRGILKKRTPHGVEVEKPYPGESLKNFLKRAGQEIPKGMEQIVEILDKL